jgi:hypothetical protein
MVVVAMISVYAAQTNYTHQHRHHGTRSNKTRRDSTGQKYSHALLELSTPFSSHFLF